MIYEAIEFRERTHYRQYVPAQGTDFPDYLTRLSDWLENTDDETHKQTMFQLAHWLFFFNREEMIKLHQVAFQGPIWRWMIDELDLRLDAGNLDSAVHSELENHTWFCPITDSMTIADFHHANRIGGVDYRPDFRSLARFGKADEVRRYMREHSAANQAVQPLRRIVLLEDFVGSGTQVEDAIAFATGLHEDITVLIVPLIICPTGDEFIRGIMGKYSNLAYQPVVLLDQDLFITGTSVHEDDTLQRAIQVLAEETYGLVRGAGGVGRRPYSAFGFAETGAIVVLYSNTPANTLPVIQHESNSWRPLFPRSARIR